MSCIWEKPQFAKAREGYAKGNAKVTSKHHSREGYAKCNAKHFRMMTNLFLARLRFILASIINFRIGLSQSCTSAWSLDSAGVSGRPPHPQTDPKEFVEFTRSRNKGYAKHFLQFQASSHQWTRFEYWAVIFHMKIECVIILRSAARVSQYLAFRPQCHVSNCFQRLGKCTIPDFVKKSTDAKVTWRLREG